MHSHIAGLGRSRKGDMHALQKNAFGPSAATSASPPIAAPGSGWEFGIKSAQFWHCPVMIVVREWTKIQWNEVRPTAVLRQTLQYYP